MKPKLFYGGQPGDGYGWGVCNRHLIQEFQNYYAVETLTPQSKDWDNPQLPGILWTPIRNESLHSTCPARGLRTIGYTFFENLLPISAAYAAHHYDLIFAGSTWCTERLRAAGIPNTATLIQGIDAQIFNAEGGEVPPDSPFTIFSGGKMELRKGQDLVIRAVHVLQQRYADVRLVCAWHNAWPESLQTMASSPYLRFELGTGSWPQQVTHLCAVNGLNPTVLRAMPNLSQEKLAGLYRKTHLGLFPNRCEGGTNLVMMEYMACGRPVIASNWSGHTDILTPENSYALRPARSLQVKNRAGDLVADWSEPDLEELVEKLDFAYHHRDELGEKGESAGTHLTKFTWAETARKAHLMIGGESDTFP